MKEKIELRKARDFGQIINDGIVFTGQNLKPYLKSFITICGFFVVATAVTSILWLTKTLHLRNTAALGTSPYRVFGVEYFLLLLFGCLNGISTMLVTLCYMAVYRDKNREAPTVAEVWGYFKYYFLRICGSCILLTLIAIAIIFISVVMLFAIGAGGNPLVAGIVVLLLLIPLIYFLTILSLMFPIMIMENGNFSFSFGKSFKLVKGKWWTTFGVLVISACMVYACMLLVRIPFAIIGGASLFFTVLNTSLTMSIAFSIVSSIISVVAVFPWIMANMAYCSYVEEKESAGLFERIDTLGTTEPEDNLLPNEEY